MRGRTSTENSNVTIVIFISSPQILWLQNHDSQITVIATKGNILKSQRKPRIEFRTGGLLQDMANYGNNSNAC